MQDLYPLIDGLIMPFVFFGLPIIGLKIIGAVIVVNRLLSQDLDD